MLHTVYGHVGHNEVKNHGRFGMTNDGHTFRWLMHPAMEAAFEEKVVEKVKGKSYGSDYGPLNHPVARDQVAKQVRDSMEQGAKLLYGGETDRKGVDCKCHSRNIRLFRPLCGLGNLLRNIP